MAIAVLEESQLQTIIRDAVKLATAELRDELERSRTPELMNKVQLTKYLDCHVSSINRFMKGGMPYEMLGEHPRFRKADIDTWLKHGRIQEISGETHNGKGSELPEGSLVGAQVHSRPDHSSIDSRSAE
jgi:hypothetical protein